MKKQVKVLSVLLAAFLLPLAAILFNEPSRALAQSRQQTVSEACSPLDVVLLIDQSDSMSGANGATPTDPLEQREYATKAVIDLLTDNALDQCPDTIHRVAVVSYGTTAQIDLDLTEINPNDPEEAETIRESLKAQIQADALGQTHPQAAFEVAAQILDGSAPVFEGENRKRVIIFITDGVPCLRDLGCGTGTFYPAQYALDMQQQVAEAFPYDNTLLEREACLRELRASIGPNEPLPPQEVNTCLETYQPADAAYRNSTYIWMILLRSGQAYPADLQNIYTAMAQDHGGELISLSDNRQDVPTTFRNILEQLTGVRAARLQCGSFAVNPYLQTARLVFYKFDPSVVVSLSYTDVAGVEHTITNGQGDTGFTVADYYQEGANERYELTRPYPGIWQLQSENCDGLDAFYEPIAFTLGGYTNTGLPSALPQRDRAPFFDPENSQYLLYEMTDEAGHPVPQADHDRFAVQIELVVTDPEGEERPYNMEWVESEQLFRATEPVLSPIAGSYTISVTGTTFEHVGESTNVPSSQYGEVFTSTRLLFQDSAGFTVFPVAAFALEIISPAEGETLAPIHGAANLNSRPPILPIPVRARVIDRQSNTLTDLAAIFTDPEEAIAATLTAGSDSATITLIPDPAAHGEYIGQFDDFDPAGEHNLTINLSSDFRQEFYPDSRSDQISFARADRVWHFEILTPTVGLDLRPIHQSIREGWPLPVNPISLRARLVDENGRPFSNLDEVLPYAPGVLSGTVTAGEVVTTTMLAPDPNAPGEYVGQINDLDVRGEHHLVVDLGLDYPGYFTPDSVATESTFSRNDIFYTAPAFYYALLAALILFIVILIVRYFAIRTNPVRGTLAFLDASHEIAAFGLYSGRNMTKIKRKTLKSYPELELKQVKVSSIGKRKASGDADYMDSSANDGNVRVSYTTDSGQKHSVDLPPKFPAPFGDGVFRIEYRPDEFQSSGLS